MKTHGHNPDYRKDPPQGSRFCCICQRGLGEDAGIRVFVLDGGHELVAVEDVGEAIANGIFDRGWPDSYVGHDCARSIPAEFLDKAETTQRAES